MMGAFQSEATFPVQAPDLKPVCKSVMDEFLRRGYEVTGIPKSPGEWHISITKGGMFEAVLGMRTALNVEIRQKPEGVYAKAGIGIFGQQILPLLIARFVFWPVLLTQVWGIVSQSHLDKDALAVIERSLMANGATAAPGATTRCSRCGAALSPRAKFCSECGSPQ